MEPPTRRAPILLSRAFEAASAASASAATSPMRRTPLAEGVLAELLRVVDPAVRPGHVLAQGLVKEPQAVLIHGVRADQGHSGGQGARGQARLVRAGRDQVVMLTAQHGESGGEPVAQLRLVIFLDRRVQILTQVIGGHPRQAGDTDVG
jgi:hypothetical protein